jgi:hypothetical protein
MKSNTFIVLAAMMGAALVSAEIHNWFCNNGGCAGGSCRYNGHFAENQCHSNPDGTQTFIQAQCVTSYPKGLCVLSHNFGPAVLFPDGKCSYATAVSQTTPCDICMPVGPNGKSMIINGCNVGGVQVTFNYDCNTDCSSCGNQITLNSTCANAAGYLVDVANPVTECPTLISYTTYSDVNCTQQIIGEMYYVSGPQFCNGHEYSSNAAANLFSCA